MTRIRARCPGCGDVEFGVEEIVVMGPVELAASYRFRCPECTDSVERSAVPEVLELLLSAGVRCEAAITHKPKASAPPLNERDLQSFEALLSKPGWFESLESSVRGEAE
jgi:predicted RNA-binding Zn-ribbon protein involved in translation (DUF1610 family)